MIIGLVRWCAYLKIVRSRRTTVGPRIDPERVWRIPEEVRGMLLVGALLTGALQMYTHGIIVCNITPVIEPNPFD
jgi:hypothetical protein